jgi:polyphosphate kinase
MGINKADFINRDLSWLSFNDRVLQEAEDPTVPLMERLRFLGIFSNNRDEFYRVRVATIRRMEKFGKKGKELVGADPVKLLEKIQEIVVVQQKKFDTLYKEISKEIRKENIFILDEKGLNATQQQFVRDYFNTRVSTFLIPIMIETSPQFPYLKDRMIYLAVKFTQGGKEKKTKYSLIEVPTDFLSRFVVLPSTPDRKCIILLEDIIRYCLKDVYAIFSFDSIDAYAIKITRDSELELETDVSKSLVEKISKSVKQRKKGQPVRLVYDENIPQDLFNFITKKIKLKDSEYLIPGGREHNFRDFINFPRVGRKELWYRPIRPVEHPMLIGQKSALNVIRKNDILLAYPYNTFNHIIDILREAAIDPRVVSIKITMYRAARDSSIVNALVNAVRNGKQVTAVVELQARFDEETNIYYAGKLQEEGVQVIFGVPGLKVHSKLFLITRKEERKTVHYAHIGTGNFNENTARTYTDHALLTSDKNICREVEKLFGFYQNNYKTGHYNHLIVSPFSARKRYNALIANETKNAKGGKEAWMVLKMNSLSDPDIIERLYEASKAGVRIKLIVRGICSLVPGIRGLSENIEVISIVDQFLEHSRILIFCNGGKNKYFISSGDWMHRNLDFRSEVSVPIYDSKLQEQLKKYVSIQLKDNSKARWQNLEGKNNTYVKGTEGNRVRSQYEIYRIIAGGQLGTIRSTDIFFNNTDSAKKNDKMISPAVPVTNV